MTGKIYKYFMVSMIHLGLIVLIFSCTMPDENIEYGADNPDPWAPNYQVAQLDSLVPSYAYPTIAVTLRGSGFDTRSNDNNFVWFESSRATVTNVWNDSLQVIVPLPYPLDFFFHDTIQVKVALQGSYNWSNTVPFAFKPMAHQYLATTYPALHPEDKFTKPRGLAFDSEGNLYLVNARLRSIYKDTPPGGERTLFSFGARYEGGLKFGPDGYLYAAALTGNEIVRVSPDGSSYETWVSIPNPFGIDFDEQGNLFAVDMVNSDVYKINPQGVSKRILNLTGQNIISYCRYHQSEIYINAVKGAALYHFPSASDTVTAVDTLALEDVQYLNDLVFDDQGSIYLAGGEARVNAIYKVTAAGDATKLVELGSELTFLVYHDKFLYISRLDGPVYEVLIPAGL
jgi:sugar lactone lactonase YvrE